MHLTRDDIFGRPSELLLPRETVDIPAAGGPVLIRTLTYGEVLELHKLQKKASSGIEIYAHLLAKACITEAGVPLFVGEDIAELKILPWSVVGPIGDAVMKLSHMTSESGE